jgi:F-type H+-transporting ATPase subunit b
MLSRLANKAVASPSWIQVQVRNHHYYYPEKGPCANPEGVPTDKWTLPKVTVADPHPDWNSAERDHVNFPRRNALDQYKEPPIRPHWVPEGYFSALFPKTGVTGPYLIPFGITTFLFSKEWYNWDDSAVRGLLVWVIISFAVKELGPMASQENKELLEDMTEKAVAIRQDQIDSCKAQIEAENKAQYMATSYEELIAAKKEAIGLQLEAEYRSRLQTAYNEVKRKLDYQAEVNNVIRRTEQKHMVDWIISNVRKSITAKQEDAALKQCIADLNAMAK